MMLNQLVNTPIGQGRYQGRLVPDIDGHSDGQLALVRLPINEETRTQLNQSNCLTPKATTTGLWSFNESELR